MKVKTCLIYLMLLLAEVIAINNGHCNFNGITEDDWQNGYVYGKITDYTIPIIIYETNTPAEIITERSNYLTASVNASESILVIETNENFANLDKDTPTTSEDLVAISGDFVFLCPDGDSTLSFSLIVQDSNNHDPKFNSNLYEFKLPEKTFEVGEDISKYGPEIIVTDVDFSNQDIVFTLVPGGAITIESEFLGNKKYKAVLKAENVSLISPTIGYGIVAYDHPWRNDEPHRNSRSQINFNFVPDEGTRFKLNSILLFVLTLLWLYNVR